MKKRQLLQIALGLTMAVMGTHAISGEEAGKSIIVFYSWGGHTEKLVEQISRLTGARVIEIKSLYKFSSNPHQTADESRSQRENGDYPDIAVPVIDFSRYKRIYIGAPVWNARIPTPLWTFLNRNNLVGKELFVFSCYQGSGASGFLSDIRGLVPKSSLKKSFFHIESEPISQEELKSFIG